MKDEKPNLIVQGSKATEVAVNSNNDRTYTMEALMNLLFPRRRCELMGHDWNYSEYTEFSAFYTHTLRKPRRCLRCGITWDEYIHGGAL
jgi:hypothetical protein